MADDDKKAEDEVKDAKGQEADADGGGDAGAAPEPKKKSRKKLYIVLGLLFVLGMSGIIGVIAYDEYQKRQAAKNWGMKTLTEEEKKALEEEKKEKETQAFVEKKHINRTFFDECRLMSEQYTTPKGWNYARLPLSMLLGLPKYSGDGAIDERCAEFANILEHMESVAHHTRHVFMCKGSVFKLPGGYYFEVDPGGRGVLHGHEALPQDKKFIPIKPGKSKIYAQWQFYNVGDGCNVIGYSKMRGAIFTMSGEVVEK